MEHFVETPIKVAFGAIFPVFAVVEGDGAIAVFSRHGRAAVAFHEQIQLSELFISGLHDRGEKQYRPERVKNLEALFGLLSRYKTFLDEKQLPHPMILWNCPTPDPQNAQLVPLVTMIDAIGKHLEAEKPPQTGDSP